MQPKLAIIRVSLGCSAPYTKNCCTHNLDSFLSSSTFSNEPLFVLCIFRAGDMRESIYKLATAKALDWDQD